MEIEKSIAEFLKRNSGSDEIISADDVFQSGLVNSLFAMQIVMFVQREFEIVISDADLTIDNFKNFEAIVDLVRRKRGGRVVTA
ncbi:MULTISPECIES: acyl carrier protein [Burkholderia]|uniref:acyl carrier protein n=1 Tax=Burkholderia TaxID=32008 RepID=UPI0005316C0B|nr:MULTISPECIES: acyl carrier protein [Burkholderia]ANW54296.1 hypothetical protein A7U58_30530 [Burkholderia pseudomallei]ANW60245.1 hypothetical protein A7U59_30460 [Burkholderia pseudomallei]ARK95176.1 hypothetical protein BOC43_12855 [Burkholderia pseudomallei]KGS72992.1 phosphopantetheine attachment site family protein [Burkholderia pseudomallei MSHR5596]KKI74053.1 hypothetical protein VU09_19895 [Burkholderia pseudomallei]